MFILHSYIFSIFLLASTHARAHTTSSFLSSRVAVYSGRLFSIRGRGVHRFQCLSNAIYILRYYLASSRTGLRKKKISTSQSSLLFSLSLSHMQGHMRAYSQEIRGQGVWEPAGLTKSVVKGCGEERELFCTTKRQQPKRKKE